MSFKFRPPTIDQQRAKKAQSQTLRKFLDENFSGELGLPEELRLLERFKETGEAKYRDRVQLAYSPLLIKLARQYGRTAEMQEDIFQEAAYGFLIGLERYDVSKARTVKGFMKPATFALTYAQKFVHLYLEQNETLVKLPRELYRALSKDRQKIKDEDGHSHDGRLLCDETAEGTRYSVAELELARAARGRVSEYGTVPVFDLDGEDEEHSNEGDGMNGIACNNASPLYAECLEALESLGDDGRILAVFLVEALRNNTNALHEAVPKDFATKGIEYLNKLSANDRKYLQAALKVGGDSLYTLFGSRASGPYKEAKARAVEVLLGLACLLDPNAEHRARVTLGLKERKYNQRIPKTRGQLYPTGKPATGVAMETQEQAVNKLSALVLADYLQREPAGRQRKQLGIDLRSAGVYCVTYGTKYLGEIVTRMEGNNERWYSIACTFIPATTRSI